MSLVIRLLSYYNNPGYSGRNQKRGEDGSPYSKAEQAKQVEQAKRKSTLLYALYTLASADTLASTDTGRNSHVLLWYTLWPESAPSSDKLFL